MANIYDNMGKLELRAHCKEKGIKNYGKMTVSDMRNACAVFDESIASTVASNPEALNLDTLTLNGLNGTCPHCGINHLDNGYNLHDDIALEKGAAYAVANHPREYSCLGCNGEWGKVVEYDEDVLNPPAEVVSTPARGGTGIAIQKDREERNGLKRPSVGGKCDAVWSFCDAYNAEHGKTPMPKDLKAWAAANGFNANNAVIELYQWRKWAGISK